MNIPTFLKGDSLTRLLQGVALGAIASMMLGFGWGGWMLGSTAEKQASKRSSSALISALAPICVDKFQSSINAVANLAALNDESSYRRYQKIEEGGWAVFPGSDMAVDGVAKECAKILVES